MMDAQTFMSSPVGLLAILAIAVLVHEPWRWIGLYVGNTLPAGSQVFEIVRFMATALVAGLVMRLVLFPAGALEGVDLGVRLSAFIAGVALFVLSGRQLALGVFGSAAVLVVGQLLMQ